MLYLIIGLSIFGLPELSQSYKDQVYIYIMPVGYGLGHIGRVGSVFVTVSVTIERYFAIVHPLKHFSGKKYLLLIPSLMAVQWQCSHTVIVARLVEAVTVMVVVAAPQ